VTPAASLEIAPCPVCGAIADVELASADAVRDEMEALWRFHTRRLRPETPPERLTDRVAFSQRPALRIARCPDCGTVYRNPRERADSLSAVYEGESAESGVLEGLFENQRVAYRAQARRLRAALGRRGSGLEVGSYVGAFLAAAGEEGLQFVGVDVNAAACAFSRAKGFSVTDGDLDAIPQTQRFDAVAFWNCFDQLPDPRAAAVAARRRLTPGGFVAIRVPNGGFYAALRPALRGALAPIARELLAHNNLLGFPYRHGFTASSLSRLLRDCGFEVARTHGDALVPIADEWTRVWAAAEERLVKAVLRAVGRTGAAAAPWFEIYARAL
jgi:SAM-dependent methyltransferase